MLFVGHTPHSWHDRHKCSVLQESGVRRAISKLRYRDYVKLLDLDYWHLVLIELSHTRDDKWISGRSILATTDGA